MQTQTEHTLRNMAVGAHAAIDGMGQPVGQSSLHKASEGTFQPCITFPNLLGDITITWDEKNEAFVKAMVQKKMDDGYVFFVIKPRRIFGMDMPRVKTKVRKVSDLDNVDTVRIKTDDLSVAKDFVVDLPASEARTVKIEQEGMAVAFDARDDDLNIGLKDDKLKLARSNPRDEKIAVGRAKSADEVVKGQSVGTRRVVGG